MNFQETELGFEYHTASYLAFFGKHNSSIDNLRKAYPYLDWSWVKQTHSDKMVEVDSLYTGNVEADAQWTKLPKVALITRTADCIPLLGYHKPTKTVVSIHAGWRGVAQRIVPKALELLKGSNRILSGWEIWIGPHIMQSSFEIKDDSLSLLKLSTSLPFENWIQKTDAGYKAHLLKVVENQLLDLEFSSSQIHEMVFDTQTDLRFHSYRRDRENSGRQISFIALM